MKENYLGAGILIIMLWACLEISLSPLLTAQTKDIPLGSNETFTAEDSLNVLLDSLYNEGIFNGFSVAIVNEKGSLYNQGFGWADVKEEKKYTDQTIQNIASISKVIIGLALVKAEEMNLLKLDDPINQHLPFEVRNPHFPEEIITVQQLASHTSSLLDNYLLWNSCYIFQEEDSKSGEHLNKYPQKFNSPDDYMDLKSFLRAFLTEEGQFYADSSFAKTKPGSTYEYSNAGAALCALIIESVAQQPFNEFTQEYIFKPLGMTSTGWFIEEVDATRHAQLYFEDQVIPPYKILTYPDGSLITSSQDLAKLLTELIAGYEGRGVLLSPKQYEQLFKSQLNKEQLGDRENFNAGLFLEKRTKYNVIGHSGGDPGVTTLFYFDTEKKIGRLLITNTDSEKENSGDVYWGIWDALAKYQERLKK